MLDERIEIVRKQYNLSKDDFWKLPQGRDVWLVKHAALEVVAAKAGITFDMPEILEAKSADGVAAICVRGVYGDRAIWSIGEASPKNCKNAYPWAIAEKRAIDRVILKLIGLHGLVYSEEESDDFRANGNRASQSNDEPKAAPVQQEHLKANGKPAKGWRADGTRTSYWLKTNGTWDVLKAMLDDDMLDCHTLRALEVLKEDYRQMARELRLNKQFLDGLNHEFNAHEKAIMEKMDAEELAEVPLRDALTKSLANNPLQAG
jgi:hypothetical protein